MGRPLSIATLQSDVYSVRMSVKFESGAGNYNFITIVLLVSLYVSNYAALSVPFFP
jgi:hypothetical protein